MQYEYFYGAQAEQFSFYRIPKALFTEPNFRELSTDAKVLYGILLDRMSLSLKNQWLDVYNAMASLSIATLCYQELHGIAVNFLKSYLAVALQGAVLYLVIGFYPALAGSLGTGGSITEQAWAMLGQSVILLVAVFMSGKFTKAITNAVG